MRPERSRLHDILEAIRDIEEFTSGRELGSLAGDALARRAILHALIVVGEAAAGLSDAFKSQHSGVPWRQIVAFRNVLVHDYSRVDWSIICDLLLLELPDLRDQVRAILNIEFPEDAGLL